MNFLKNNDKENTLKAAGGRKDTLCTNIRVTLYFLSKTKQERKQWHHLFQSAKRKENLSSQNSTHRENIFEKLWQKFITSRYMYGKVYFPFPEWKWYQIEILTYRKEWRIMKLIITWVNVWFLYVNIYLRAMSI